MKLITKILCGGLIAFSLLIPNYLFAQQDQPLYTSDVSMVCTKMEPLKIMEIMAVQNDKEAFTKFQTKLLTENKICGIAEENMKLFVVALVENTRNIVMVRKEGEIEIFYTYIALLKRNKDKKETIIDEFPKGMEQKKSIVEPKNKKVGI